MKNVPCTGVINLCENPAGDIIVHLRTSADLDFKESLSPYGPIESNSGLRHDRVWQPGTALQQRFVAPFFSLVN